MRYLGIGFCVLALLFVSQAKVVVDALPQLGAVIAGVVVELTNNERIGEGLSHLSTSDALTRVAELKARDMAEKGYFAHVSPEGVTPWHWFGEAGYTFVYAGENLAVDFYESPDVVRAWMNSPTHRANIVGTQFTEIGVAVAEGTFEGRPATFVVQVFGTPRREVALPVPERRVEETVPVEAETPALATTLAGEPPTQVEVLGETAGTYLATPPNVPWWYQLLHVFF